MPGRVPQKGLHQATGGPRAPFRGGARPQVTRVVAIGYNRKEGVESKPLSVLLCNAEGLSRKKASFNE